MLIKISISFHFDSRFWNVSLTWFLSEISKFKILIFEIEDDGIGIEEKDYEIAFHPFTRLDKSRNQNNHSGVGLGLSIANDVIRMHGGQLSLYKSTALGGLGVRIRLPI